jgi:hypothetical protein
LSACTSNRGLALRRLRCRTDARCKRHNSCSARCRPAWSDRERHLVPLWRSAPTRTSPSPMAAPRRSPWREPPDGSHRGERWWRVMRSCRDSLVAAHRVACLVMILNGSDCHSRPVPDRRPGAAGSPHEPFETH